MNDEIKSTGARLQRIKVVSRIAKWIVLAVLVFAVWLELPMLLASFLPRHHGTVDLFRNPLGPLFEAMREAIHADWSLLLYGCVQDFYGFVLCFWYWKLTQLFRLYERGQIFGAETIGCIKHLWLLCMVGWIFMSLMHFLYQPPFHPQFRRE
jgi:hypothetical protein